MTALKQLTPKEVEKLEEVIRKERMAKAANTRQEAGPTDRARVLDALTK